MAVQKRNVKVDVITMGCSKNLVDSEFLIRQFKAGGFEVAHDPEVSKGEVVIINTCGFIGDAKEESIETILQFAEAREQGKVKQLIVMGCLSERYMSDLKGELPEVDKFYGKFDWKGIVNDLGLEYRADLRNERSITTPAHYAFLKVSEGCNRGCSYCAIPIITGPHISRSIEDIKDEVQRLRDQGVRELQVVAQDLSFYGVDLYKKPSLARLVEELAQISGIDWIRLHYAYPAGFPEDVLRVMRDTPNVCNYMDIALQHVSDSMLKRMRRGVTRQQTIDLVDRMRATVPNLHLRTTFIAGHPGETDEDFEILKQFVRDARFERMGVFAYSHEEDTYAYKNYQDDVPDEVKQARVEELMAIQADISRQVNENKVGQTLKVIIDRPEGDGFIGRTEYDSPEVDPEVIVKGDGLQVGQFYDVKITAAEDYDLVGEVE
ncbi:ribosomal protein S12 methylthiotransferase [Breznakibacter xylanolyticus]|uniref:Ribosomal protein uS12 methylthiotransferase RimO n=1 Tax=Breznakibacter xylanolyticus TaxID=990 RepID=A0A2W7NVR6_9BACT|nr:30S ribosomal protein S12 methylthiotransferase RimO [Breznakibacter xylanolyticus]MBN2743005.1 30S ribosomal protein S12 methylthiotransferase RimO [Marinilabiliaceae bacterium]PZX15322.1 ribosomal protein S12 methylthiotransferase [Breznakibacter xylanolyticus]